MGVSPAPQNPIIVISPTAVARASAGTTSCMAGEDTAIEQCFAGARGQQHASDRHRRACVGQPSKSHRQRQPQGERIEKCERRPRCQPLGQECADGYEQKSGEVDRHRAVQRCARQIEAELIVEERRCPR